MPHTYFLEFLGEDLELLQTTQAIGCEQEFFGRLVRAIDQKRLHLIEMQVTLLFDKFETINHRSHCWSDNLKTLLAHGFRLKRDDVILKKSFYPLSFNLVVEGDLVPIHFGSFHRSICQSVPDQFIRFCVQTEYPPGIHRHVISEVLANSGGQLLADNGSKSTLLIKGDPKTGVLAGDDDLLEFILNMAF